jgi:peptide methionine sulfoxide reductase msrA/msrB
MDSIRSRYPSEIVTEILPLQNFYVAEEYHQEYLVKNPSGYCHIDLQAMERAEQTKKYIRTDKAELEKKLSPLSFAVTQNAATEAPFENEYYDLFQRGIYVDITTGQPLFTSSDKFESGCGWPAFSKPIDAHLVTEQEDLQIPGRPRTEIRSKNSDAHLGHVFEDGPSELGGLRYCINSAALRFIPYSEMDTQGYTQYKYLCT